MEDLIFCEGIIWLFLRPQHPFEIGHEPGGTRGRAPCQFFGKPFHATLLGETMKEVQQVPMMMLLADNPHNHWNGSTEINIRQGIDCLQLLV